MVIPNKRFDGSPEDALRAALEKLATHCDGQIVDHHVVLGKTHVVHHDHARSRHVDGLDDAPVPADMHVLHMIFETGPAIGHRMQISRVRIDLGVCTERLIRERAEEVVHTNRFEFVGEFHGW